MNSAEIRICVLGEIMDDYEEVEWITENVSKRGGVAVQRQEIVDALIRLTEDGFAKAYRLSGREAQEIEGVPSLDEIQNSDPYARCYFLRSSAGADEFTRLCSLDSCPFDEDGEWKR